MLPGRDIQGIGFQPQKLKKIGYLKNGKNIQKDIKNTKVLKYHQINSKRSCTFCSMKGSVSIGKLMKEFAQLIKI